MARTATSVEGGGGKKLISAKEAANIAVKYFREITGISEGISLEEVELSKDQTSWNITIGYKDPRASPYDLQTQTVYKSFMIDSRSRKVLSMKIRKL
ncbi:MAG: hypothetical protein ACKKMV_03495 [Candidatus Nealsonbacteria bacterium]